MGLAVAVLVGDGVGEIERDGDGIGDAVGDGEAEVVGEGDAVGDEFGEGVTVGVGVGVGKSTLRTRIFTVVVTET